MEERKNNSVVMAVIITILVMVVLGLIGFIVYDKVINKTNEPNMEENNNESSNENKDTDGVKEISINDSLITSLKYPMNVFAVNERKHWNYKNVTIDSLGRKNMMYTAAYDLEPIENTDGKEINLYSATQIENNFRSIFGPNTEYYNGDVEDECCQISKYSQEDNTYLANCTCGGDSLGYIDRLSKTYKAEQHGDYIYVYDYVQSVAVEPVDIFDEEIEMNVYLLDQNDKKTTTINYDNYESTIYNLMGEGKVDTYKWTFKKQSDGKYYFYSGAWEK